MRSVWFYHCAKAVEIKSFLKGGEPPKVHLMINAIETIDGYTDKMLSAIKGKVWKSLNGFTHGGYFQVKSRINAREVISSYDNKQIIELIYFSTKISLLSATTVSWVTNNVEIGCKLLEAYKSIYKEQVE